MADTHLDPARSIIAEIGVDTVAKITGKHVSRVYRWMYPKERGGTGGLIPQCYQFAILKYAKENGVALSEKDFFPGRHASQGDLAGPDDPVPPADMSGPAAMEAAE